MKYVMLQSEDGRRVPVVFPNHLTHLVVAYAIAATSVSKTRAVSAGFVDISTLGCSGKSESLGLQHDPDDPLYIWGGDAVAYMEPDFIRPLFEKWKKLGKNQE